VLPPLNRFECYETHRRPARVYGVTTDDVFGSAVVDLKKLKRLCAPADLAGTDPTAPTDPDHLGIYTIKQTSPKFRPIRGVTVTTEFGSLTMNITKADRLLVPTAKSVLGPVDLPAMFNVDHFKCYKVAYAKFRTTGLDIEDQFDRYMIDLKKPSHLCVNVDKNGEGIPDLTQNLLCFKPIVSPGTAPPNMPPVVFTHDQFGSDSFSLYGPRDFCVPAQLTLP
jgi:hypothetical protein